MKFKSLLLLALAVLLSLAAPRPARALEVSFDFFYDSLSPYGEWIEVGDYGYCWRPTGVDEEWTPYSDGYWTYTDAGWTWVSYEEFGGIVYHYGRWTRIEDEGWCWVPDYEWGPAWVSWRRSDDYVGWAPLPAEARWQPDRGISVWVDTSYDIGPASYSFCRYRDFGAPVLRPVILPRRENIVIINNTVNVTNITYNTNAGCVFNGGLDYGYVNRFSRRQVPALKLVRNTNMTVVNNHIVNNNVRVTNFNSVQRGNQLTVIAPTVTRAPRERLDQLLKPKVTKVIPQQKVTRGWGSVPADERAAIRAKFLDQIQGKTPETAPATALKTADLKVVPVRADPKAKLPTINRNVPAVAPKPVAKDEIQTPEVISPVPAAKPLVVVPKPTPIPGKLAGEKPTGRRPGKVATPEPLNAPGFTDNPPPAKVLPATPAPVVRARPQPVRPAIVKPFNPQAGDDAPSSRGRLPATPPSVNPAIEKSNAAVEAAKEKAALQQAASRQRAMEASEQQQAIARRNTAQGAAARQQMLQQQKQLQQQKLQQAPPSPPAEVPTARRRAVEPPVVQENQQQQQMVREKAAQAAEARQRSASAQQAQQAAAARVQALQQAQAQAVARQRAAAQVQPQRSVPQAVPRNVPPPAAQSPRAPVKPGKKSLTPEEAAQLQQQQQVR